MRKLIFLAALLAVAYFGADKLGRLGTPLVIPPAVSQSIDAAYRNQANNVQVTGTGLVIRVLADDNDGSRHQRFILRLQSGQTLLVAHNIDLAPRIADLSKGDEVEFNGEYVWNSQGGVLHWTHHDPDGKHVAGWLKHEGHTYQ